MKAVLTITGGPQCDRQWSVESDQSLTLGRGSQADVVLLDAEISRLHCTVLFREGHWRVEDKGSLNGTFVNGERVKESVLHPGDRLRMGSTTMRFDAAAEHLAPPVEVDEVPRCRRCGQPLPPGSVTCPACDTHRVAGVGTEVIEPGARAAVHPLPPGFAPPTVVRVERETTIGAFIEKHPRDTSNVVTSTWQKIWYILLLAALLYLPIQDPLDFLHVVHVLCLFYLIVIVYKLLTVFLSVVHHWEIRPTADQVAALRDEDLPVYTILVPLYREREVARKVVRYVSELDYPKDKLDVKILLEPDDAQTLEAIRETGLPAYCEVIICPDSQPRTKPKACNHGLARARGELLVIYDAEDRPEPDQLKKAVVAFQKAELGWQRWSGLRRWNPLMRRNGRTVCLQAKLNYYNPKQNLLTRWFTIEYATWFQLYLPGLHALRAPIPLGGTSNHFRTGVLREIGGWDPFNVTEDCDLGIRLHKLGYRTQVVDSTTWEEANSRLWNWTRQRSRWVKGYIQTHLTHMRHPFRTLWRLRPWGMFNFLNSVGGLSVMLLLNPIFWASSLLFAGLFAVDLHQHGYSLEGALGVEEAYRDAESPVRLDRTIRIPHPGRWAWPIICGARPDAVPDDATWTEKVWLAIREDWRYNWEETWEADRGLHFWNIASQVFFLCTVALVLGNVFFVLMHVVACFRARMPGMIPFALFMPLYWVFISLAAWKGFFQLFRRPFYWEKTQHGLDGH